MSIQGLLSLDALAKQVTEGAIETVVVGFTDHYGRLVGKRFDAQFFLDQVAEDGTHACDYLLTVDMEMEPVQGYQFANWQEGYGDVHLVPDLSTLRTAAWLPSTALILCDVESVAGHQPITIAPRSMLRKQIERAQTSKFVPLAGSELEYFLFRESYRSAAAKGYRGLEAAGWYIEDYQLLQGARVEDYHTAARRMLTLSGVPVECTKGEWGHGQHELNIQYSEILTMADRHAIYKQCLKELADSMGVSVTFMAKFAEDGAGSSNHIHISLTDASSGKNVFAGDDDFEGIRCTDTFRHFLGGWMAYIGETMPFYAPTVNSYKRYQPSSWAPTNFAWSRDNRTAGFRIVGEGRSLRIECRVPGADANPYLAYAAALASGLEGIKQKIEPPPLFTGDAYSDTSIPSVPLTLQEAIGRFEKSEFARQAFGDEVVEHYLHFFQMEAAAYQRAVTDWERQRYFERI